MSLKQPIKRVFNPDLPFVKENYLGNKTINDIYQNEEERYHPSWFQMLRWGLSINPQRKAKKQDTYKVSFLDNRKFLVSKEDMIVWLGHSAFFIRMNGVQFLIDPCLQSMPFYKRHVGLPCHIEDFREIDYILLSHGHRDHCDIPSLKKILKHNPQAEFLTAMSMSKVLKPLGKIKVQEAGWYQQFKTHNIEITFLPAMHWNRRYLHDMNKTLWGSFFIKTENQSLYFAGDTGYGKHFKEIRETMGAPDFCFMPIAAYSPEYIMKGAHVNPLEAIKAFHELGASHFIPMHYGTYDLSDEPMGEPITKIRRAFSSKRMRGNLAEIAVGEMLKIPTSKKNQFRKTQ